MSELLRQTGVGLVESGAGIHARTPITPVDTASVTAVVATLMLNLSDPADWDTPAFPLSVAAQAARVTVGAMRMWFERGKVTLQKDDSAGSRSAPARLLTWRSVLTLAATADLSRGAAGDVGLAYAQARHWTMMGAREQLGGQWYEAVPAGVFSGDYILTVLVHWGEEYAKVVPVDYRDPAGVKGLPLDLLFPSRHPVRAAPRLLALDWVHRHAWGVCEGFLRPPVGWEDRLVSPHSGAGAAEVSRG